jgi:acyl transferase domain-containing protein
VTRGGQPRIAGVSSFGFGGTNAHVIVAEAPARETRPKRMERPAHILTISAKTPSVLQELVRRYHSYLGGTSEHIGDICYTASAGRSHFEHRVSVSAASVEELREKLAASGSTGPYRSHPAVPGAGQPRIALLFGGSPPMCTCGRRSSRRNQRSEGCCRTASMSRARFRVAILTTARSSHFNTP